MADASVPQATEAVAVGGDDAAEGRAVGMWRIERQELPALPQGGLQVGEAGPGAHRDREVGGDVVDDAGDRRRLEDAVRADELPEVGLRARAANADGPPVAGGLGERHGAGGGVGRAQSRARHERRFRRSNSAHLDGVGKSLPGFISPAGSHADLSRSIAARSAGPNCSGM